MEYARPRTRPMHYGLCFALIITLLSATTFAETVRVAIGQREDSLSDRILLAALERGQRYTVTNPYSEGSIPLSTLINDVEQGSLDIFATMSSPEYEDRFQAIYIPIFKGLLGMRLGIIKKEKKDLFAQVKSLEDLQQFSAGQGTFWTDARILEANGIPVIKEIKYSNLFRMLEAERFDFFPRGLQEPWLEVSSRGPLNLQVDESIMLWYQAPFYFFVNKKNKSLAAHITEQFEAMIADGSYAEIFDNDQGIKMALEKANISNRTVIKLKNPFLTDKTPLDREELWLNPMELNLQNPLADSTL